MRRHQQNHVPAHSRHNHCDNRSEEDYHSYVTHVEKKTSMTEGPHLGNMQQVFKRVEVYEEVDEKESEAAGRFGRSKHSGRNHNACEDTVDSESTEYIRSKHDYLIKAT